MSQKENLREKIPRINFIVEAEKSSGTKDIHLKFRLNQKGSDIVIARLFNLEGTFYNLEQGLIKLWNLKSGSKLKVIVEVKNRNNRKKGQ